VLARRVPRSAGGRRYPGTASVLSSPGVCEYRASVIGAPPAREWCAALGALEGWPWVWPQSVLHQAPGASTAVRASCRILSHIEACWGLGGTHAPRTRSFVRASLYKDGYLHSPARPPTACLVGAAATATPTTYAPTTATPTFLPSPSPATAPTPLPAAGMRTGWA
jgi:hypothetical protein